MDDFVNLYNYTSFGEAIKLAQQEIEPLKSMTLTGGSGRGWSRFTALQRCPRAFYYIYGRGDTTAESGTTVEFGSRSDNLDIGGGVHALLAVYYMHGKVLAEQFWSEITRYNLEPKVRDEVKRIFTGYVDYYGDNDYIIPLAAEVHSANQETGDTCRYDLIARIDEPPVGQLPGFYLIEHKTLGIFSEVNLDSWDIDGEILGEAAFWSRGGFEEKYGPLEGICINIIGKQKEQKFHRTFVSPSKYQIDQHLSSLNYYRAYENMLVQEATWPRATSNCVNRYGRCDFYEACRGH